MKINKYLAFLPILFLLALSCDNRKNFFANNAPAPNIVSKIQKVSVADIGKKFSRDLDNESHIYEVELVEMELLSIDFEQFGIDIQIRIISPDGDEFAYDFQRGIRGKELFIFISKTQGMHKLIISPANDNVLPGKYEFEVKDIRTATKLDFVKYQAIKEITKAKQIIDLADDRDLVNVIETLERNSQTLIDCGDLYHSCFTQYYLGNANLLNNKYKKARFFYNQAIEKADTIIEPNLKIYPIAGLAITSIKEDKLNESINYFKKGIDLATQTGDLLKKSDLLNENAKLYIDLYETTLGEVFLKNALTLQKQFAGRRAVLLAYLELGSMYYTNSEYQKSIEMLLNALQIGEKYNAEGNIYALILLTKSYVAINDNNNAIKYALDAHKCVKSLKDKSLESLVFHELANVYGLNGDTEKAMYFYQLAIEKAQYSMAKLTFLNSLGDFYFRLGNLSEAQKTLDEALKTSKEKFFNLQNYVIYQKAITSLTRGKIFLNQRDYKNADRCFKESLATYKNYEIIDLQAEVLFYRAKLFLEKGNFKEAEKNIRESIELRELIGENLAVQDLQLFFLTTLENHYNLYIELLVKRWRISKKDSDLKAALTIVEKSKTRILSRTLSNYSGNTTFKKSNNNFYENLALKRESLANSISKLRREKINLINQVNFEDEQLIKLEKKITELKNQNHVLEAQLKKKEKLPSPLDFQMIEKALDDDTTVIEYYLSNSCGLVFVINKATLQCFEIQKFSEIDTIIKRIKNGLSKTQYVDTSLSQAISEILFGSINLQSLKNRLVIIPGGSLNYLPWSALRLESEKKYLIEKYELIILPSISTLIAQKKNLKKQADEVLVISDPVLDQTDQRISKLDKLPPIVKKETVLKPSTKISLSISNYNRKFSRLHFSQKESEVIVGNFPKVKDLSGFNASLKNIINFQGKRLFIFHLATHTILNTQEPELSYVVLSLFDKTGNKINGYLTLADIYNLDISADIVVLSSCESGVGREIKGEGILSFSYAFISTGSSSVISSLWKVDDRFTSIFMEVFYKYLKEDVTKPAAALQKAQIKFANDPNWNNPFYWGAFIIQGMWN